MAVSAGFHFPHEDTPWGNIIYTCRHKSSGSQLMILYLVNYSICPLDFYYIIVMILLPLLLV